MKRRAAFFALLGLAVVQLAVPLRMIAKRQDVLETGQPFRFRTAPVDPYDAFRGRYVALAMADSSIAVDHPETYAPGQRIYVLLRTDEQGFARPAGVERRRPHQAPYVEARVAWGPARGELRLDYPFDRYYLNEELAPAAEQAYRQHAGDERQAWVAVRIKDGFAVIEELYVAGVPIGEHLRHGGS